jgi:hypothetical protein
MVKQYFTPVFAMQFLEVEFSFDKTSGYDVVSGRDLSP